MPKTYIRTIFCVQIIAISTFLFFLSSLFDLHSKFPVEIGWRLNEVVHAFLRLRFSFNLIYTICFVVKSHTQLFDACYSLKLNFDYLHMNNRFRRRRITSSHVSLLFFFRWKCCSSSASALIILTDYDLCFDYIKTTMNEQKTHIFLK